MEKIGLELFIVLLLILANGFFAGAELAIVSVRRGRIAQLAAEGSRRAKLVEQLLSDPHRFLATVQIGVTLVGTAASAVGGAAAVEVIKPLLQQVPIRLVANAAEPLALFLVVGFIAYLSLILGELVPKALALEYSDRIALGVARPIRFLARIGGIPVFILTLSSQAVLRLLGIKASGEQAFITKEEIEHLVAEGRQAGTVTPGEQEFIRNVFEFSQTQVREVMVPRPRIVALDLEGDQELILKTVLNGQYSRYPVYRGEIENVIGFIHAKDLLGRAVQAQTVDVESLLRPAFFVPETKRTNDLLREMQRRHLHMAIVVDEYGGLSGIVTTEDLLEELVGEIEDEHDIGGPKRIQPIKDGGYMVDAFLTLNDLEGLLGVRFPEGVPYDTLSGLILFELGHIPVEGEKVKWGDYLLTCVKVSQTAIRRVKIEPAGLEKTWKE
ncbi:hemolysin family protein [Desulfuromonas sp. TF]|uniref:hemolysin family protein n=1 Tax=Desulfuromonas sp. TF TaxID=1232410 RepID=UPI00040E0A88|nr:hemolysin family protein [Desulfuromonas sp. TF]